MNEYIPSKIKKNITSWAIGWMIKGF